MIKDVDRDLEGIKVKGAREHNLKNINVFIPRKKITLITGLSGSGKSSLAFDTVYAEGQRRYLEGLSAYARQFLEQLKKPAVDSISGLSPAIAIDQKSVGHNPRSTVGTITEVYDYLRLLFAKIGEPECPKHQIPLSSQTPQEILEDIFCMPLGTRFSILAPMFEGKKGEFLNEFQKWIQKGFLKAKIDGQFVYLEDMGKLEKNKLHNIDLVIDQLSLKEVNKSRIQDGLHSALILTKGRITIETFDGKRQTFSLFSICPNCGFTFPQLEPRLFSFNNPRGACGHCYGTGLTISSLEENPEQLELEVEENEYAPLASKTAVGRSSEDVRDDSSNEVISSSGDDSSSEDSTASLSNQCTQCKGARLKPEALSVKVGGKNISELSEMNCEDLMSWVEKLKVSKRQEIIAQKITQKIILGLKPLIQVGTGYLSLNRSTRTLSGGEGQRIRLASQVASSLIGVLYVMDEPSIGLHPQDHQKLLSLLKELKDKGNTILLVEHDEDTIRSADHIIDLGPRAGRLGGNLIVEGSLQTVEQCEESLTGKYLSKKFCVPLPKHRLLGTGKHIEIIGAQSNNLRNVHLKIPLGTLTLVTGVSGSGKSTLIIDTLYRLVNFNLFRRNTHSLSSTDSNKNKDQKGPSILGLENLDKVIRIDQQPIGRTPRSIPATYVGLLPLIRTLYSEIPEAKVRGYKPGRFSFNIKGGRCEVCQGHGQVKMEMHFLANVYVTCDSCQGARFNPETLKILYKNKSIQDVLNMTVEEALHFFNHHPSLAQKLETLHQVGLDYMILGQSSTTLSGGEAQRIKLSRELSKRSTGKTLYILDEPTTGLHFEDVRKLIELLQQLRDQGNTVVVIEHNLDVIKCSDWIIDMGPGGGHHGGQIIATGTPEDIVSSGTPTGKVLAEKLFN